MKTSNQSLIFVFLQSQNRITMARFELKLPKMGESVAEATITSWLKEVGDTIELDEAVVEIRQIEEEISLKYELPADGYEG